MYNNRTDSAGGFPDPLASQQTKLTKEYGLKYAKAIEGQWGDGQDSMSTLGGRKNTFIRNRDYANGTQDTTIYKQLLNQSDPNAGDGSLMNLDFTAVPILPKFVRIVVNKILSRNPYPNIEATDPLSSSEKNIQKNIQRNKVKLRKEFMDMQEMLGRPLAGIDANQIPDTEEEVELLMNTNIKTDAEIAAQVATDLTLSWANFEDNTFRRCVNDLAALGMAVVKRKNDPNYGIDVDYVDPVNFVHSYTDDPNFEDLVYAGYVREIPLHELKRIAGDELTDDDLKKISKKARRSTSNRYPNKPYATAGPEKDQYSGYLVEVLDFEFLSVDCMFFEEKANRHGNTNFFYEGFEYKERKGSVYDRTPHKMEVECVYQGTYILGTDHLINYRKQYNTPKNMHDISRASLSFCVIATNMVANLPKSMIDSCIGFADMLQLTHLKIQQAIAKAKPDGLIIDIEGLENVQLGKAGELQPLDLHDIYEQTGVFYYRSKNPEGGFQNPPVREIGNSIRNINELIGLYNHYLRMIRDTTGINEMVDASTPKSDTLVGVQRQAIAASNNATFDITNAAMLLYKKVCQDVVKCVQILPPESIIYKAYENAIGKTNLSVLSSFSQLPMYNFGVQVLKDMEDRDAQLLEQNIQIALSQKEIDLEDAMAVRNLKDVTQAERLLILRRSKRMEKAQQRALQNSQMQAQQAQQAAEAASQAKLQEVELQTQADAKLLELKTKSQLAILQAEHQMNKEIEMLKMQRFDNEKQLEFNRRSQIESQKDDRKDDRVKKQAVEQSKLISQRTGKRPELQEEKRSNVLEMLNQMRQNG
tara:strand:- start:955 stop:3399 length:2445 start_codon:yes stop_codon:yes gene_type:complete